MVHQHNLAVADPAPAHSRGPQSSWRCQLIDDWADVDPLAGEWTALLSQSDADSLFLSWPWLEAWRRVHQTEYRPLILTVRDADERLIGIAPCYLTELQLLGRLRYQTLRILGDTESGAEYPNFIALDRDAATIKQYLLTELTELRHHWDLLWLPRLAGWHDSIATLEQALTQTPNLAFHKRPAEFSAIALPDEMSDFLGTLSKSLRTNIRQTEQKLHRHGELRIRRCQSVDEVAFFLEQLFVLHQQRWQHVGQPGAFARRPKMAEFYRHFVPQAQAAGWLRFYLLEVDNHARAAQIGYCYNNRFYALQEGFDPRFIQGAGQLLRARAIEDCISQGLKEYDFLGEFSNHKRRWRATARTGYDFLVWNNNPRNAIFRWRALWPTGRWLRSPGRK